MDQLKSGKFQQNKTDDAYETGIGIGTQFSAETNTRDEDAEMQVEEARLYIMIMLEFIKLINDPLQVEIY